MKLDDDRGDLGAAGGLDHDRGLLCGSVAVAQARAVQEKPPSAARAQPCARDALIAAAGRGAGATVPADMGRMAVAAAACDVEILGPPPFETDV